MSTLLYHHIREAKVNGKKLFAVLIDPDNQHLDHLPLVLEHAANNKVDFIFVGGSLVVNDMLEEVIRTIRTSCNLPIILFPGNVYQLNNGADGVLLLSLISGRNAELLIGKHVVAAPFLKKSDLEILPTGYMLVDGGVPTSVSYISNTSAIPSDKKDIATCTAMAGEMLGLKLIFMDAGSGAKTPVSPEMIQAVSQSIDIPLIVGGGIRTPQMMQAAYEAGADLVVIGDKIEKDPDLIRSFSEVVRHFSYEIKS